MAKKRSITYYDHPDNLRIIKEYAANHDMSMAGVLRNAVHDILRKSGHTPKRYRGYFCTSA